MTMRTDIPAEEPLIIMTRVYNAPRELVWRVVTEPAHVRQWWGGPGFTSLECEMDVRPGGRWHHVMRSIAGYEIRLAFTFLEVQEPYRLAWQPAGDGAPQGPPGAHTTVTLEDLGHGTRWTMVARFKSMEDRAAALAIGYGAPIAASCDSLDLYLDALH